MVVEAYDSNLAINAELKHLRTKRDHLKHMTAAADKLIDELEFSRVEKENLEEEIAGLARIYLNCRARLDQVLNNP